MTSPPEEAKEVESRPRKLVVHVVHSRLLSAPALDRVLSIALAAIGVVALVSCGLVAAAHVGDDSRLTPAAGSWMALAHYLNDGTLYPPLYDGHAFGGTRYMPLSIVLLAGVERLIGDYIVAAKVLSIVTAVALLSVVFWLLRRERCSIAVSLALVGALATSPTGVFAITSARNDALPVVLQLLALMLVVRTSGHGDSWRRAPSAPSRWSRRPRPSGALWRSGSGSLSDIAQVSSRSSQLSGSVVGLFGLFEVVSDGRFAENVIGLSTAGDRGTATPRYVLRTYVDNVHAGLGPVRLLLAVAFIAALIGFWRRTSTIFQIGLASALFVLVPVYADVGTVSNHLIDSAALAIVVTGGLFAATSPASLRGRLLSVGLVVCVLAVAVATYRGSLRVLGIREAARELTGRVRTPTLRTQLAGYVRPGDAILSEDPKVPVALAQHPVVLDPFILLRLAQTHPAWQRDLIRRLHGHEFAEIFLEHRPEQMERSTDVRFWYSTLFFGRPIVAAIARDYRAVGKVERLWVYRPRVLPPGAARRAIAPRGPDAHPR